MDTPQTPPAPDGTPRSGDDPSLLPGGIPATAEPPAAGPTPEPGRLTLPAVVLQFFIFPLAVVVVCVLVYLSFVWMTYESRGPKELLAAVGDAGTGKESRLLAAAEFARILEGHVQEARRGRTSPEDPLVLPPAIGDLAPAALEAFRKPPQDDTRDLIRSYLATTLGLFRHRPAVPDLLQALEGASPDLTIALLGALAAIGDPAAVPAHLAALTHADAGIRKQAVFGLGLLQDPRAVPPLKGRLQDDAHDVRWNAALALSRFRDDPSALDAARPVIVQMLDRAHVRQVVAHTGRSRGLGAWDRLWEGMAFSEEDLVSYAMVKAMNAVMRLRDRSFEARLETIGAGDENVKVRECAMRTLAEIRRTQ